LIISIGPFMQANTVALLLLTSEAVRTRSNKLLAVGVDGKLLHFHIDLKRLDAASDLVIETMLAAYPSLEVPLHSRWRHFEFQGTDRWAVTRRKLGSADEAAQARSAFDLSVISVLLDAGAGATWRYHDLVSGQTIGHSEGLALASLTMFENGVFSAEPSDPLRADAAVLRNLQAGQIRLGLQITESNPMIGLDGRIALLRRLGRTVSENPNIFGRHDSPRPGGLFDILVRDAHDGTISAPSILTKLLTHLANVWPSRLTLDGVALGDCWRHPLMSAEDETDGFVPLHTLAQWLTYSLIEPLQWAGLHVMDVDGLTGLAEYRNGGLFVDTGVLTLRDPSQAMNEHDVSSALVVEWRALTVALLDLLAQMIRRRLNSDAGSFPLAKLLQGGTWSTGRALARKLRPNGTPPIRVVSDGSVF